MDETTIDDSARMRWRCRRGMLELDILLNSFLDNGYQLLESDLVKIFDTLLDYPDQVLFDLLLEKMQPSDHNLGRLIQKIRESV
jgi:antitoxin CptB